MTILRVFPRRTSYTPDDAMVLIGHPAMRECPGQTEMPRTRTHVEKGTSMWDY